MGQQQLLLLVLSTVIVGLATVAGIQAFSENQAQATQDALIQRTTQIASDLVAADSKPSQLGGIDLTKSNTTQWANAIGLSSASSIDADGAGDGASCSINDGTGDGPANGSYSIGPDAYVECTAGSGSSAEVEVGIDPNASGDKIETAIVSVASV